MIRNKQSLIDRRDKMYLSSLLLQRNKLLYSPLNIGLEWESATGKGKIQLSYHLGQLLRFRKLFINLFGEVLVRFEDLPFRHNGS